MACKFFYPVEKNQERLRSNKKQRVENKVLN